MYNLVSCVSVFDHIKSRTDSWIEFIFALCILIHGKKLGTLDKILGDCGG